MDEVGSSIFEIISILGQMKIKLRFNLNAWGKKRLNPYYASKIAEIINLPNKNANNPI